MGKKTQGKHYRAIILAGWVSGLAMAGTSRATDYNWTGAAGDSLWASPMNWTPAGSPTVGDGAFFSAAFGSGGTVDLGGGGVFADQVYFDQQFLDQASGYRPTNGSITTPLISVADDVGGEFTLVDAPVSAPMGDLVVTLYGGSIDFQQPVTADQIRIDGLNGGEVRFSNAANTISTKITAFEKSVSAYGAGSLGTAEVELVNSNLYIVEGGVTASYGNDITIRDFTYGALIAYAQTFPQPVGDDLVFGKLTVGQSSDAPIYGTNGFKFVFSEIAVGFGASIGGNSFDQTARTLVKTGSVQAVGFNSTVEMDGEIDLTITGDGSTSAVSRYDVRRGQLTLAFSTAVPGGSILDAANYGSVFLNVPQFLPTELRATGYSAVGGDLTGRIYSGPAKNTFLSLGTIIASYTPDANVPVRGVDVFAPDYYLGLTSTTQAVTVGADPSSIYQGAAVGLFTPDGFISATFDTYAPTQDLRVLMTGPARYFQNSTFNGNSLQFFGPAEVRFLGPQNIAGNFISHTGSPTQNTQGNFIFTLYGAGALQNGKTLEIFNGTFFTGEADTMENGSQVIISDTAAYYVGDFFGVASSPTTGYINVQSGGIVRTTSATPGHGATFNFVDGSYVLLGQSFDSLTPSWIPPQADLVLGDGAITVAGEGIVLGEGKRLTTQHYGDGLVEVGAPILRDGAASRVLFTATSDTTFGFTQTLTIRTKVDLPGTTLEVGSPDLFVTLSGTYREEVGQAGTVRIEGDLLANTVDVRAGSLYFGTNDLDVYNDGTFEADRLVYRSAGDSAFFGGTVRVTGHAIEAGFLSYYNRNMVYPGQPYTNVSFGSVFYGLVESSTFETPIDPAIPQLIVGFAGHLTQFGPADPFTDNKGTMDESDDESMNAVVEAGVLTIYSPIRLGWVSGRTGVIENFAFGSSFGSLQTGTLSLVGGTLEVRPGGGTIELLELTVASGGGILLTNDNDMLVDYTGTSPIEGIVAALLAGQLVPFGDDGFGLPTYLAIAEAVDLGLSEFNGISVDETSVVMKYTYVGDANLDGQVDALDYERVDLAIGNTGVFGVAQGDLNYDGNVDALDYEQIDLNIGNGVGSPLAAVFVPEPAGMGAAAASALLLGRRRRR